MARCLHILGVPLALLALRIQAHSLGVQAHSQDGRKALVRHEAHQPPFEGARHNPRLTYPTDSPKIQQQLHQHEQEFGAEALGRWEPESPMVYSCNRSYHSQVPLDTVYNFSVPFRLIMNITADSAITEGTAELTPPHVGGGIFVARSSTGPRLELRMNEERRLQLWLCKGADTDCISTGAVPETGEQSLLILAANRAYNVIVEWNGKVAKWLIDGVLQHAWKTTHGFGATRPVLCYVNGDQSIDHAYEGAGAWFGNIKALDYSQIYNCGEGEGFGVNDGDEVYNLTHPFRLSFEVMAKSEGGHHGQVFSARRSKTVLEVSWTESNRLTLSLCNGKNESCTEPGTISSQTDALGRGRGYVVDIEWDGKVASWSVDGVKQHSWLSKTGYGVAYPILCRPPDNDLDTGFRGQVADLRLMRLTSRAAVVANATSKAVAINTTTSSH